MAALGAGGPVKAVPIGLVWDRLHAQIVTIGLVLCNGVPGRRRHEGPILATSWGAAAGAAGWRLPEDAGRVDVGGGLPAALESARRRRRTNNRRVSDAENIGAAARAIAAADALLITAGAGMGVDSGLPDFRGDHGFWNAYAAYRQLSLSFANLELTRLGGHPRSAK